MKQRPQNYPRSVDLEMPLDRRRPGGAPARAVGGSGFAGGKMQGSVRKPVYILRVARPLRIPAAPRWESLTKLRPGFFSPASSRAGARPVTGWAAPAQAITQRFWRGPKIHPPPADHPQKTRLRPQHLREHNWRWCSGGYGSGIAEASRSQSVFRAPKASRRAASRDHQQIQCAVPLSCLS